MEALRRLTGRARNKSKSQVEVPAKDASTRPISNEAPPSSRTTTSKWSRSSNILSRAKSRNLASDVSNARSDEFQKLAPTDEARKSDVNARIQPVLVGVSRPSGTQTRPENKESRPTTAESIQRAVDKAADLAAQTKSRSSSQLSGTKSPRYVDILTITGQTDIPNPAFNEDIAKRNIDTVNGALDNEAISQPSSPSKYQEEVATRNILSPLPETQADGLSRRSEDEPSSAARTHDSVLHHSRQQSMRTQETTEQLPTIPQERNSDDDLAKDQGLRSTRRERNDDTLEIVDRQRNRGTTLPGALEISTSARNESAATELLSPEEHVQAQQKVNRSGSEGVQLEPMPEYVLSANEAQRRMRAFDARSRATDRSARSSDQALPREYLRPPSAMSLSSSVKRSINLSNRTIMDLTGDDSEVFSVHSTDYPETPIIQSATSDTYQKLKPSIVEAPGKLKNIPNPLQIVDRATPDMAAWPPTPTDNYRLDDDRYSDHVTQVSRSLRSVTPPAPNFAFSGVIPLASTSPRSSGTLLNSMQDSDEQGESKSRRRSLDETLAKSNLQPPQLKAIKEDQVMSAGNTPMQSPEFKADQEQTISPLPTPQQLSSQGDPMETITAPAEKAYEAIREATASNSTSVISNPVPESTNPPPPTTIHTSPESLQSRDFTHPTEAFGVKSRDFAFAATAQPPQKLTSPTLEKSKIAVNKAVAKQQVETKEVSVPKTDEPKKVQQNSSAPRKSKTVSTWDEEGFRRKQAEARAALIRLQHSLNEELPPIDELTSSKEPIRDSEEFFGDGPIGSSSVHANESKRHGPRNSIEANGPVQSAKAISRPEVGKRTSSGPTYHSYHDEATLPSSSRIATREDWRSGRTKHRHSKPLSQNMNPRPGHPNPVLSRIDQEEEVVPNSPGEISLSSFPIPTSRDRSPDLHTRSFSSNSALMSGLVRRGSQASRMSSASAYSIPYHMVPGRGSSLRDRIAVEQGRLNFE